MSGRCTIDFLSNCTRCGGLTPDCTGIFMESSCQIRDDTSLFNTYFVYKWRRSIQYILICIHRVFNFVIYCRLLLFILSFPNQTKNLAIVLNSTRDGVDSLNFVIYIPLNYICMYNIDFRLDPPSPSFW